MKKILLLFLGYIGLFCHVLTGQNVYIDQADFYVTSNTIVSVEGNLINQGSMSNDGLLYLQADWENRSTYIPQNGAIILNSASTQNFYHNAQTIANLVIEGGGEKSLTSDATVSNKLDLNQGIIRTESNTALSINTSVSISGASDLSHVEGNVNNMGLGQMIFPIGINHEYRPVVLESSTDANVIFGFTVFSNLPNTVNSSGFEKIYHTHYWKMNAISGSSPNAKVRLSFGASDSVEVIENLIVIESSNLSSIFTDLGKSAYSGDASQGNVLSEQNATATYFALALKGENLESLIFIPNAFSPNAPGIEDRCMKIYGNQIDPAMPFSFKVFDNGKKIVFQTNSLQQMTESGWNGLNYKSQKEEIQGVYTWIMIATLLNGKEVKKSGTVLLLK